MAQFERRRLNNRTVAALKFDRETLVWDRHLPGFAVRVYPSGTCTYVVQTRGPYGARRVTLGRHGAIGATEARRRAWQVIARIKAGKEPLPEHSVSRRATGPKLADMAARYMDEYVAVHCKPATLRIRSAAIYRHLVPRLGKLRIGAIRRRHVTRLHQRLAATPVEANNAVITLSQIFTKAQDWGILAEGANPCRHVELYRQRKRERFLTEAEFKRLGRVLDESEENGGATPAAIAAIRLLILTGCRRGEILGLRWDDVDLESRELRLRDTKTGPRTVPLSPAAVKLLAGLPRYEGGPWVIPGRKPGTHLVRLGNAWRLLRKRAGLNDVRLHDLRHSFASSALALGESLPMIARLLGHRQIASTARYAHLARASVHEAAARVADSLAEDIL
ncbi:MAG: site-specific integrase [Rhodospirillaceae bacterium]|nr:site-specific integrase [Rhodospirillaceae bacterium]